MLTTANISSSMALTYYLKNGQQQGTSRWIGEGAARLGLSGAR